MITIPFQISEDLAYGEPEGFSVIDGPTIDWKSRWSIGMSKIIGNAAGEFFRISWSEGATEYQDHDIEVYATPVRPVQKVVTVYEDIEGESQ